MERPCVKGRHNTFTSEHFLKHGMVPHMVIMGMAGEHCFYIDCMFLQIMD